MWETKLLAKLSEVDMIAWQACYLEHCMTKFRNKFCKFYKDQENDVKDVQKSLEATAFAECMSFIEDSLQSSDEVAPFIKLSVVRKFYSHCLENFKAPIVSGNVTRLKENLLKLNLNLEATSRKKEVFISFKNGLAAALEYSQEHSLQNNTKHFSRSVHIIQNKIFEKDGHFTSSFTDNCQMNQFQLYFFSR